MKYNHVRLVAKVPCAHCNGAESKPEVAEDVFYCDPCKGRGERETELLHPGEPFFLVRGQDRLAALTVGVYMLLAGDAGANVDGLGELRQRMTEFQEANPGLVKLPD
jgi:hypothetical protein